MDDTGMFSWTSITTHEAGVVCSILVVLGCRSNNGLIGCICEISCHIGAYQILLTAIHILSQVHITCTIAMHSQCLITNKYTSNFHGCAHYTMPTDQSKG